MKNLMLSILLLIPFNCLAGGELKWKLDLAYKTNDVKIVEYDVVFNQVVPFTVQSYSSKKGKYALQEPTLIIIVAIDAATGKEHTYLAPGIPDEELIIIDKNDGRYDFDGSTFYKKFHEIDVLNDEFNKTPEEHDIRIVEYIKNHSDDEASAMIIPIALRGKNELIESTAKILGPNVKNGRLRNYIEYMINQEQIERFCWLKMSDFLQVENYKLVPVFRIIGSDARDLAYSVRLKENPYLADHFGKRYYVDEDGIKKMLYKTNSYAGGDGIYDVSINKDGNYECSFEKPLYVEEAYNGNNGNNGNNENRNKMFILVKKIGNVKDYVDRKHERCLFEFQTMVSCSTNTASEMEKIANTYSSGKLSCVGLEGYIKPNASEAEKWRKRSLEKAEEEKRQQIEAQLEKERQEQAKREAEEKAKLEAQKKKEDQERRGKEIIKELIKKYGKRDVEAAERGEVVIGMHEDIFALLIMYRGATLSMKSDNGNTKVYDIYALRDFTSTWIGRVTIRNHRVAYMNYGKRWSY